jgi:hypothetical protein
MPRKVLDFEGIAAVYATFLAHGDVSAVYLASGAAFIEASKNAVAIMGNGIAGYGSAGYSLLGKIKKYDDDHYMTVQVKGFATMPGISGTLAAAGDALCVDGAGAVSKVVLISPTALVPTTAKAVSVDNSANTNTIMVFIG